MSVMAYSAWMVGWAAVCVIGSRFVNDPVPAWIGAAAIMGFWIAKMTLVMEKGGGARSPQRRRGTEI